MGKKILVVDDEKMITKSIAMRLSNENYEVDVADDGASALGKFVACEDDSAYDLVILDIMMPGMDGVEVLKAMRREEKLRGIDYGDGVPVIMLTALKEKCFDSFNEGCDDYIVKPFKSEDLIAKVAEKLG